MHLLGRLSLTARFVVLSTVVVGLLGVALTRSLAERIEQRAHAAAQETAHAIAVSGVEEHVSHRMLGPMRDSELDSLDGLLRTERLRATGVRRLKIFDADARIVYSDDRTQIGRSATHSDLVATALDGRTASKVVMGTAHNGRGEQLIEAYVPLAREDQGRPVGAVEVYLPYEPVAAAIRADTQFTGGVIAVGLLVLWLALFRIVQRASRTLRRQAEENSRQAREDPLTGLPNRRALHERAPAVLAGGDGGVALLLVDLDHFKEINDTLGHHHGDLLLCDVAERLSAAMEPGEILARLGGDEFAVLLSGMRDAEQATVRAAQVLSVFDKPVSIASLSVRVEASVGVAVHGADGSTVEELLQHADVAMYNAKETTERICVYSAELDPYSQDRLRLAGELRDAITSRQLVVHYQPIVAARDGQVYGAEALVRWAHPERGLIPPGDFLPLAERTGDMKHLTRLVIEQAVRDAHRWEAANRGLHVAVNLASSSANDLELPGLVAAALERWPLSPELLTLELSENTVISDPERVGEVLKQLSALGVRLALDDFGTGRASLGHLRRLPLDELKIDRSFVSRILEDPDDRTLVEAIVLLADGLRLQTVGEGVEDEATAGALSGLGCHYLQGFHYSRPVPVEDFEAWLSVRRPQAPVSFTATLSADTPAGESAPSRAPVVRRDAQTTG